MARQVINEPRRTLFVWSTLQAHGYSPELGGDGTLRVGDRTVKVTGVLSTRLRPQADIWIDSHILDDAKPADLIAHVLELPTESYVRFITVADLQTLGRSVNPHYVSIPPKDCVLPKRVNLLLRVA